ncbi:MAG TPA: GtrA family protein [Acidimicrobiales bacterium]|jgi:putative flippase GtrA|nr:GtrA family protein [Acidimicrobiales bacterium]
MILSPGALLKWSRTHEGRRLIRYATASVITTIVSLAAVSGFYGLRIIPSEIWATLAGNVVGMFPAYQLNRRWTWGRNGRSHWRREILPFLCMSMLGIAFSQIGAWWARNEVRSHHWSHLANTGLVDGANLLCFGVFWVLKLIVFNRIFQVKRLEQMDEHLRVEEETAL